MGKTRIRHDAAFAAAKASLDVVAPCLREEEQAEVFGIFYQIAVASLEAYEAMVQREANRLHPSDN